MVFAGRLHQMHGSTKTNYQMTPIRHSENKNVTKLKMCESEVKAAMPKIINGTAALTS